MRSPPGADFWQVMVDRYGLSLEVAQGRLDAIPREGPLILIANHPYGILDGLMMGHILSHTRGDFRILANSVFRKAEELNRFILPVSFDETRAAIATNLETRRRIALISLGKAAPSVYSQVGPVATSAKPFSRPMDPGWRSFTATDGGKDPMRPSCRSFSKGRTAGCSNSQAIMHQTLRLGSA